MSSSGTETARYQFSVPDCAVPFVDGARREFEAPRKLLCLSEWQVFLPSYTVRVPERVRTTEPVVDGSKVDRIALL